MFWLRSECKQRFVSSFVWILPRTKVYVHPTKNVIYSLDMTIWRSWKYLVFSFAILRLNDSHHWIQQWYIQDLDVSENDMSWDSMKHFFMLKIKARYFHESTYFLRLRKSGMGARLEGHSGCCPKSLRPLFCGYRINGPCMMLAIKAM